MTRPLLVPTVIAAAACTACTATTPQWDRQFGDSVVQLRAAQVSVPSAPARAASAPMADGKAVAGAMKNYAESYGYAVKAQPQGITLTATPGR